MVTLFKYNSNNYLPKRILWMIVWNLITIPFPKSKGRFIKIYILRLFGADIHITANVYSSARIYAPWNLKMDKYSCLAPEVDCYNVDKISIGFKSIVSQKTYLCTASHNISDPNFKLIKSPIIIENNVWVGAAAFIGMGTTIGQGAVVGATASVFKDVPSWTVVGGNPAKFIKKRVLDA